MANSAATQTIPIGTRFDTDVPQRLDRLPWSKWHWRIVIALGVTWMLDGLEVTLVGAVGPVLRETDTLNLSEAQIGASASAYLFGAIAGALVFGRLTDMLGRKKLFLVTLTVYLLSTLASGLAWNFWSFAVFRALTGAGIGGEYSAVNSAIDELLPARVRGRADLAINSTYWIGAALGAGMSLLFFNTDLIPHAIAWRLVFCLGAVLGVSVWVIRHHVPESPRWLLLHGRVDEANAVISAIEHDLEHERGGPLPQPAAAGPFEAKGSVSFSAIARVLLKKHLRRTVLGLSLMITQAFAYNGVFFTYALVLARFYGVPAGHIGYYLLPFSLGNVLGPLVLGHFFDSWGRKRMIVLTYALSGVLIAITGYGLAHEWLSAGSQTAMWCVVFFVASAAASSSYLTVSELFPVELRGMAIALFYAVGTAAGGLAAPALFGYLVQSGERSQVFIGYLIGAVLMILAAGVALFFGVSAERKSLETINEL